MKRLPVCEQDQGRQGGQTGRKVDLYDSMNYIQVSHESKNLGMNPGNTDESEETPHGVIKPPVE